MYNFLNFFMGFVLNTKNNQTEVCELQKKFMFPQNSICFKNECFENLENVFK